MKHVRYRMKLAEVRIFLENLDVGQEIDETGVHSMTRGGGLIYYDETDHDVLHFIQLPRWLKEKYASHSTENHNSEYDRTR